MKKKYFLFGCGLLFMFFCFISCKNKKTIDIKTSLEKVLEINELKSLEYVYNSYVIATNSETQEKLKKIEKESEFVSLLKKQDLTYKEHKALFYDAKDIFDKYENYSELKSYGEDILYLNDFSMLYYDSNLNNEESFIFLKNKSNDVFEYFQELELEATKNSNVIYDTVAGGVSSAYKALTSLVGKNPVTTEEAEKPVLPASIQKVLDASENKFLQINDDKLYESMLNRVNNIYTEDYVYNLKKDNMKYAAAYHGSIKLGIDEPITFEVNETRKIVSIKIPTVKVLDLNIKTLGEKAPKLLYGEGKYKKDESVTKEVFTLCEDDLKRQVQNDNRFFELARENLQETVKALCAPFEKATQYTFVIEE